MTSIQKALKRILQYTPLQVLLLVLAIVDVAIVVSEILVTLHVYDIERSDAEISLNSMTDFLSNLLQTNKTNNVEELKTKLNETFQHFLEKNISYYSSWRIPISKTEPKHRSKKAISSSTSENSVTSTFIHHHNPTIQKLHMVENILDIITITILAFFVLMALLHLIAEGKKFFSQVLEILDSAVSIVSLTLYVTKHSGVLRKDATEAVVVILLLWQIVHMFNGILTSEVKRKEFRIKLLKSNNNKLESKLIKRKKKMAALQHEIDNMKILCQKYGVEWLHPIRDKKIKPSLTTGIARLASLTFGVTLSSSVNLEMEKKEKKRRFGCSHVMDGDISSGKESRLAIGQLVSDVRGDGRSHNWKDEFCLTQRSEDHVEGLFLGRINEAAEYDHDDDDDDDEAPTNNNNNNINNNNIDNNNGNNNDNDKNNNNIGNFKNGHNNCNSENILEMNIIAVRQTQVPNQLNDDDDCYGDDNISQSTGNYDDNDDDGDKDGDDDDNDDGSKSTNGSHGHYISKNQEQS